MNAILKLKIRPISAKSEGFTLIEVLVASAILVILAVGFLGIQYIISQNQLTTWRNYLSIEAANIAISGMSREIRDLRQNELGGYPLEKAEDQEIIFYSDLDYDGVVERVRYTLNGSDLEKGIVEPTGDPITYPLAEEKVRVVTDIVRNGSDPFLYYYNSDWPTDTTNNPLAPEDRISDTRQIKIIIKTNPRTDEPNLDFILESDVKLRMLN